MRAVTRRSDRKPGSTRSSPAKLRISNPAPMASSTATATSATTNRPAVRPNEAAGTPVLDFQGSLHVCSRRPNRWNGPEAQPCDHARDEREAKHPAIDADLFHARDVSRHAAHQELHTPERQYQSGRPAHQGEHRAFGQELPDDAAAAGTERATNRYLALPGARSREQKIRHVRARDEEHEPHGSEHDEQSRPDVTDEAVLQQNDFAVRAPVGRKLPERSWLSAAPASATAALPGLAPLSTPGASRATT